MAYATVQDLLTYSGHDELVELTTEDGGSIDYALIESLLEDSSAEIDAHRFSGTTVPEGSRMAKRLACLLTLYYLYARRAGINPSDTRVNQFEQAQQQLFLLSQGAIGL